MTVHRRVYRGFHRALTPAFKRPWVITRFGLVDLFRSRKFFAFFLACYLPSIALMIIIYLRYNVEALSQFEMSFDKFFAIDPWYFATVLHMRMVAGLAFVMILLVGPALVSPDLRNNALPLYLSRPLNKRDYVLGKVLILVVLTSAITWIPGILLFSMQAFLAGDGWLIDNVRMPFAMVAACLVWTLCLSMTALAISAWVRWKPVARLGFLAVFFVSAALGNVITEVLGAWWGGLFDIFDAMQALAVSLYGVAGEPALPGWGAWTVIVALTVLAGFALFRRIRAYEVVT